MTPCICSFLPPFKRSPTTPVITDYTLALKTALLLGRQTPDLEQSIKRDLLLCTVFVFKHSDQLQTIEDTITHSVDHSWSLSQWMPSSAAPPGMTRYPPTSYS